MAQRIVTCGRCGRERYESRMTQGTIAVHHDYSGEPVAWKKVDYWECSGRAACRKAKKERNRRLRREKEM